MNLSTDVVVLANELDHTVGDMVEVDNGRVSVKAHSMKLVAVLHRMKKRLCGSASCKKDQDMKGQ